MMRLLELLARLPGTLLPFAVGLSLLSVAGVGWWVAVVAGAAAVAGYLLSAVVARVCVRRWGSWRNLLLGQAVAYVVVVVVLIAAVEQQRIWLVVPLSLVAGVASPAERICAPNSRLDGTAIGVSVILALVAGLVGAWSVPLALCGVAAAAAVPVLVMRRFRLGDAEAP